MSEIKKALEYGTLGGCLVDWNTKKPGTALQQDQRLLSIMIKYLKLSRQRKYLRQVGVIELKQFSYN